MRHVAAFIALAAIACTEGPSHQSPLVLTCSDPLLYSNAHDTCAAMDATAAPDDTGASCLCALGYAWDGTTCVFLGDCTCVGDDCDKLTDTLEECLDQH